MVPRNTSTHDLGRILVVDRHVEFAGMCREILVEQGHAVTVAHTSDEAFALLQERASAFDVVLVDQALPAVGGADASIVLLEIVAQTAPFARTIVMSGYADAAAIARTLNAGAYDHLTKAGLFEVRLTAAVRNALEVMSATSHIRRV